MSFRRLKKEVFEIISTGDLERLSLLPKKKAVSFLIGFLSYPDEQIKKMAIKALGLLVPKVADEDIESARIIMRKLMWNLNDESGGIGWGIPEAMAEIMKNHKTLRKEYEHILKSYARGGGNYLDFPPLEKEVRRAVESLNRIK